MDRRACQLASLTKRERLTSESSEKKTYHLELDLSQTDINYQVGDCLAIYPSNHPDLVKKILSYFPNDHVTQAQYQFLLEEANLLLPPKALTQTYGKATYLTDLLPLPINLQTFCDHLAVMTPRFYSIASSMRQVGKSAHLTVTINQTEEGSPIPFGTCSHYLCERAPLHAYCIPLFHHPAKDFKLSTHTLHAPIIMIGPGTGVAPFRAFMQERTLCGSSAKNWLFFGEQTQEGHYYYQHDWERYCNAGQLQIDLAFSREGTKKIYVQDRMLEKSELLWQWINQDKAYIYVCGDAKKMAKDVETTLMKIIERHSPCSPLEAREYIKNLRREKRYLRDVY